MAKKIDVNGLGHYHDKVSAMLASEYSSSKTYAVGDYCFHAGTLYECTTAITTAEAWTSGHWTAAKLAEDTSALKTAFVYKDITNLNPNEVYNVEQNGVQVRDPVQSANYGSQIVKVSRGDKFRLTGKGATTYRLWMFTNNNNVVTSSSAAALEATNLILTADADGYLYVHSAFAQTYRLEVLMANSIRTPIVITAIEGIQAFYDKFLYAFLKGNCDVYVRDGEYTLTNAFCESIFQSGKLYGKLIDGIPIGNDCRYFFDPSCIVSCNYTGSNTDLNHDFCVFSRIYNTKGFELHNLHCEAKNIKYIVHDEANGSKDSAISIYNNCKLNLDNTALGTDSYNLAKCIGGGLAQKHLVRINECQLSTINPSTTYAGADASYHTANNATVTDAEIFVINNYFSGGFRSGNVGTGNTVFPNSVICGNSFAKEPVIAEGQTAKIWNNEIRTDNLLGGMMYSQNTEEADSVEDSEAIENG